MECWGLLRYYMWSPSPGACLLFPIIAGVFTLPFSCSPTTEKFGGLSP